MSRLGIVCGSLVIIGLLVEFWLAAKLGYRRGEVADKLRAATEKSEKAIVEFEKSATELKTAQVNLAALKLGWGHEWTFPAANPAPVQNQGGKLFVTGIGVTTKGLDKLEDVVGADGKTTKAAPPIHIFADNGQGKVVYTGEFRLGVGPNELGETTCVLYPTWKVTPQEMASWNFTSGVRIRTQIPSGGRGELDNLNQTIARSVEQFNQLSTRIENQKKLRTDADLELQGRKNELLGDANGVVVAERPEFVDGLVRAIENIEEERNAFQIAVDSIRRKILKSVKTRTESVEGVKELAAKAAKPVTKVSTVAP